MAAPSVISIRESIVRQFVLTCESLNISGRTMQRVYRVWREPSNAGELPFACVLTGTERKATGRDGAPLRFYLCHLPIDVVVWTRIDDTDDDPDTTLHRMLADIENAITQRSPLQPGNADSIASLNWTHLDGNDVEFGRQESGMALGAIRVGSVVQYLHRDTNADQGRG